MIAARALGDPPRIASVLVIDRNDPLATWACAGSAARAIATSAAVRAKRTADLLMPCFSQDKEKTALNHIVNRSLTLSGEK